MLTCIIISSAHFQSYYCGKVNWHLKSTPSLVSLSVPFFSSCVSYVGKCIDLSNVGINFFTIFACTLRSCRKKNKFRNSRMWNIHRFCSCSFLVDLHKVLQSSLMQRAESTWKSIRFTWRCIWYNKISIKSGSWCWHRNIINFKRLHLNMKFAMPFYKDGLKQWDGFSQHKD